MTGIEPIGVGDLIVAEVLQGFRRQRDFEMARGALLSCHVFPMVGEEIALRSADNLRILRRQGITIRRTIDCLIATFVIANDHVLLRNDADFTPFEQHLELRVQGSPASFP